MNKLIVLKIFFFFYFQFYLNIHSNKNLFEFLFIRTVRPRITTNQINFHLVYYFFFYLFLI
jgi:hypothetical protein